MNFVTKLFGTLRWVANHPLHQRKKTKSVLSFCISQVAARLVPGDVCIPFPNGTLLLVCPHLKGAAHFIFPGLNEFDTMSFVLHFLRQGDLFVDAGAYVGAYTVLAGGSVGAKVIAFEPNPTTFSYLERNVHLNKLNDLVKPLNFALGNEEGTLRFTDGLGTENFVCPGSNTENTIGVKATTLDKVLESQSPTLLKIDVEGFESKVIAGAARTLSRPSLQAIIIERYGNADRYGENEAELHKRIRASLFEPCAYSPLDRKLHRLSPEDMGNIIYVRDYATVQKRLQEAPPYRFGDHTI